MDAWWACSATWGSAVGPYAGVCPTRGSAVGVLVGPLGRHGSGGRGDQLLEQRAGAHPLVAPGELAGRKVGDPAVRQRDDLARDLIFVPGGKQLLSSGRDGTIRDSVMYSVILSEWPDVKRHLLFRLSRNEKQ